MVPYREYSKFLQDTFGERVYKLPVNLPITCPNRDGNKGTGGCIFCSEEGGSHEYLDPSLSVKSQLLKNKDYMGSRYKAEKFIAYFQSFTNTYMDIEDFDSCIKEVKSVEDIVGISISTRPDCITDEYIEYFKTLNKDYMVTVELGLQSINNNTLEILNRGHYLSDFLGAVMRLKSSGIRVCTHMILDLPWDSRIDIVEAAHILSLLGVDEIKLHSLYITKGTVLGDMYENDEIKILTEREYKDRVIDFLTHLNRDIVIQRILGRVPEKNSLHANWGRSWWAIRDEIIDEMNETKLIQGMYAKY